MNPVVLAGSFLIFIYSVSEVISQKTKAYISSALFLSVFLLMAMWFGLPKDVIVQSGFLSIAELCMGLLLIHMGSLIDLEALKK